MAPKSTSGNSSSVKSGDKVLFIIAYIIPLLTGILVLLMNGNKNKRLRFHAMQAIFLGIVFFIVDVVLTFLFFIPFLGLITSVVLLLLWLYGLYVGFKAYDGTDVDIPVLADYAKRYSK